MGTARARRHSRGVGFTTAVGTFLAFGMTPLVAVPPAQADVVEDVVDQIFSSFLDAATNAVDWGALATPAAWDAFVNPAHWDAALADLDGAGSGGTGALSITPVPSAGSAADLTGLFNQFAYTPLH
ncbi:MAG: hypothetical protein ACRDU4_14425, partial [Mycobacterium sp.]